MNPILFNSQLRAPTHRRRRAVSPTSKPVLLLEPQLEISWAPHRNPFREDLETLPSCDYVDIGVKVQCLSGRQYGLPLWKDNCKGSAEVKIEWRRMSVILPHNWTIDWTNNNDISLDSSLMSHE
jgi:hypothetical protein